jgi:pimeloyl-ACP methyl ester carboxylesterase
MRTTNSTTTPTATATPPSTASATPTTTRPDRRRGGSRRRRSAGRVRRWARRGVLGLLVFLVAVTAAGQLQQFRLQRIHVAPGEQVDVGGHRLHVLRTGEDGPTVVFENGPGGMALDWAHVQPVIARETATFSYDRAGLGWSDAGPRPRDVSTLVDELHRGLEASGTRPPYVLVGHSFGGLLVRAYAATYPAEVAGLVLVDAAHEDQLRRYPEAYARKAGDLAEAMGRLRTVYGAVTASGVPALFAPWFPDPVAAKLPEQVAAARRAAPLLDASHATTVTDEMGALAEGFDQVRRLRRDLGDLPVVVIRHGDPLGADAGVPPGLEDEVEAAWRSMQDDLTTISAQGRLVVADGSGHDIHLERPDVVIDAIRDVVARIAASR